ncbi:filamentous hemagglutinin family protein [Pseudomonas sp. TE3786]
MNKHRFRLIFSKALGFLIPVAEINNAQRKPGQTKGSSIQGSECTQNPNFGLVPLAAVIRCTHQTAVRVVVRGMVGSLVALTSVPGMAAAQMIVDSAAPTDERPNVVQAGNGVPVIEIANPDAKGLSHNRFDTFNVQNPGAIFNNNKQDGVSQIGGYVLKNSQLTQQAKAILTEVTGNNPSDLSGTLEVFGGKADLLIAKRNLKFPCV